LRDYFSDINECANNVCSQKCTDTDGSFVCSCEDGFRLVDTTRCEGIVESVHIDQFLKNAKTQGCHYREILFDIRIVTK